MAARYTWRGLLRLSLITIPVRVYPATTSSSDVSFHQFHRRCKTRIQLKKWCPTCEVEVEAGDIIKGHETSRGKYVFVEEEEIKKLRPESTKTIAVSHVLAASAIEPRYVERTYYLAPDSKEARGPFAVIREGLDGKAAIGRLALHGREYLAAVVPDAAAMTLYTLRTAGEVRAQRDINDLSLSGVRVKPEEARLARRVIESFDTLPDLSSMVDNYEAALRELVRKKGAGADVGRDEGPAPAKVVNLMDALRQSLDRVRAGGASTKRGTRAPRKRPSVGPSRRKLKRAS